MDNVIFGRENIIKELRASVTLVKNAYHDSHATEFLDKNSDKYNYIAGIKGTKLLGDQK